MSESDAVKQSAEDDWDAALSEQIKSQSASGEHPVVARVFQELTSHQDQGGIQNPDMDFLLNIPVQLTVELGRTKITMKHLMQLTQGSVVELNGLAGEPLDVLINGCQIAQGEVVVVNDKFGIRLTDITSPSDRITKLNRQ